MARKPEIYRVIGKAQDGSTYAVTSCAYDGHGCHVIENQFTEPPEQRKAILEKLGARITAQMNAGRLP